MIALVLSILLTEILFQASSQNSNIDLYDSLPLSQGWQISGADYGDNLGSCVSYAGDFNNDGIDDVIISAASINTVYVIYGQQTAMAANIDLGNGLDITQGFMIFGANSADSLGSSAGYAGDFNNDGIDDIIIGANSAQSNAGEAYVIYGVDGGMSDNIYLSALDISQGFVIQGATAGDSLGTAVNFAGDVNSDGINDIIVGATGLSPPVQAQYIGAGAAYVIYGIDGGMSANIYLSTDLTSTQGFRIFGRVGAGQFGVSVNCAGDVNGDNIDDVIVGAYLANVQFVSAGIAAVIYGKPTAEAANIDLRNTLPISQGFQIIGSATDDDLGHAVSTAGDFNADGIDDILVSAFQASPSGRSQAGSVYIIYGVANGMTNDIPLSASLPLSQGFRIDGDTGWHLGYSASYAGDVNMDGISDVIIGSDKSSPEGRTYAGSAFVIYGKANGMTANIDLSAGLLLSEGFEVIGGNSNDQLGVSVSTARDFNNDGAADILLGASGAQPSGLTGAGVAYVLYGVPSCSVSKCITCSGSTCVKCAAGYFLCAEDDQCYTSDTCPSNTTPNAVDTFTQSLGVVQGAATQGISLAASAVALVNFNNPLGLLFNALAGILMYMQFMSIAYPPKLQYLLDQTDASLVAIQYFTDVPEGLVNNMPQFALPDNFENNGFTSSFLVNFWPSLMTLLIICIAIVVVCLAEYFTRSCKFVNSKINKLKEMLKWNYLLDSFSGCYGDIAMFSSFEFGTVRFGSFLEVLSFSVCILVNIALLVASVTMFTISKKLSQQKNSRKLEKLKEKLSSYQVVFENFKSTSFSQQSFVLISCLRLYLINTLLAYLYNYPLTQATLMNIQGLSFLVYLILKRPFNNTLDLITSIALELIFEVIHVCVFCFALINQKNPDETISAIGLGDGIVGCIFAFLGVQSLYMIIQMVILIIGSVIKILDFIFFFSQYQLF